MENVKIDKLPTSIKIQEHIFTIVENGEIYEPNELEKAFISNTVMENKNTLIDRDNIEITIPKGFSISKNSPLLCKEGIIIEDNKKNEFVWIPIDKNTLTVIGTSKPMAILSDEEQRDSNGRLNYKGVLYEFYDGGKSQQLADNSLNREPDILINSSFGDSSAEGIQRLKEQVGLSGSDEEVVQKFKRQLQEEYNLLIDKIKINGGFYVSRYEMGTDDNVPISKNTIPTSAARAETLSWYGLYAMAKKYGNVETSINSSMLWGSQYDAILNFALLGEDKEKVTTYGNGNFEPILNTGETITDKILNIYDLEGNLRDWTIECISSHSRTSRGSGNSKRPPCARGANTPINKDNHYGVHFTIF